MKTHLKQKQPGQPKAARESRCFWDFANKGLDKIISIVLVCVLLISFYAIFDALYLYKTTRQGVSAYADENGEKKPFPDKAISWLTINETNIDYPVMQGKTNDDYLNTDPYGKYSLTGSIFLDSRNKNDWSDKYNLLYGHHMSAGQMFGALDKYKEEDYFKSHKKGLLQTDKKDFKLTIFAVVRTDASESVLFNAGESVENTDVNAYVKKCALYYEEPKTDHYLAMSTCQSTSTTDRLIVLAAMEEAKTGTLDKKRAEFAKE